MTEYKNIEFDILSVMGNRLLHLMLLAMGKMVCCFLPLFIIVVILDLANHLLSTTAVLLQDLTNS